MNVDPHRESRDTSHHEKKSLSSWVFIFLPLVLLGILIVILQAYGPGKALRSHFPPVEEIAFQRIVLRDQEATDKRPKEIILHILNDGPSETTVAQVMVDEAYWPFEIRPKSTLKHLESAQVRLLYPWVEGETHEVTLITSTGLTFSEEIEVAVESPSPNWTYLGIFSLLGVYVGVIPVFIGLLWFPAMKNVSARGLHFLLSLTVGLLVFLAVDALHEALEVAEELPESYEGVALVTAGFAGCLLLLMTISRWARTQATQRGETFQRMVLAYMIAFGIGLHNLGEGLAIGSAYALGNIALGGLLVIGFAVHNTTEGFAIVAPVAKQRVAFRNFIWMGALAGVPTILGVWIGGFTYSAVWAVLFLSIGAGAIVQVIYVILCQMARQPEDAGVLTPHNFGGLLVGFLIMYSTGLLVTF